VKLIPILATETPYSLSKLCQIHGNPVTVEMKCDVVTKKIKVII